MKTLGLLATTAEPARADPCVIHMLKENKPFGFGKTCCKVTCPNEVKSDHPAYAQSALLAASAYCTAMSSLPCGKVLQNFTHLGTGAYSTLLLATFVMWLSHDDKLMRGNGYHTA